MKMSKLMLGACVFSLGIAAAADSYHVKVSDPTWVGTTQLKPGEYTVQVEGDKVTFKMGKNVISVPAKVEENASKFADNQMLLRTENGQSKLKELDLAGTKSKILLNDASAIEAGGTR
jgi:hypothetical protein